MGNFEQPTLFDLTLLFIVSQFDGNKTSESEAALQQSQDNLTAMSILFSFPASVNYETNASAKGFS